jgi:hypothetical protein
MIDHSSKKLNNHLDLVDATLVDILTDNPRNGEYLESLKKSIVLAEKVEKLLKVTTELRALVQGTIENYTTTTENCRKLKQRKNNLLRINSKLGSVFDLSRAVDSLEFLVERESEDIVHFETVLEVKATIEHRVTELNSDGLTVVADLRSLLGEVGWKVRSKLTALSLKAENERKEVERKIEAERKENERKIESERRETARQIEKEKRETARKIEQERKEQEKIQREIEKKERLDQEEAIRIRQKIEVEVRQLEEFERQQMERVEQEQRLYEHQKVQL